MRLVSKATRTAAMAVILAVLMLGLPSFNFGSHQTNISPVDNAIAAAGNRVLTIGWPGFTVSIATLNPLMYITTPEMMTIWPCYSFLFTRDIDAKMIGDLVTSYKVSSDGKTWDFNLVHTAKFYDKNAPAVEHNLTAADVIFTFWLVQNQSGCSLQPNFPVVDGKPIIENMWNATGDPYHLYIQLSSVYAPFLNALTSVPILPKYVWSTQVWNWDNFRTRNPVVAPIIGSGPFYYMLDSMPQIGLVDLGRSPTWFATEEHGWQLHVNKLVIKTELDRELSLYDYENGAIDIMELVSPDQFNSSLPGLRFALSTGFVYEYNLNQMTSAMRAALGGSYVHGTNNQLLLDPVVKKSMAMSVNKSGFVSGVLNGLGSVADSLVPDIHPMHYSYPTPVSFNPAQARQDLWNAGWRYDTNGNLVSANSTFYPLCRVGGTDKLQFRFWTIDSSSEWDIGARLIANWSAQAGIDLKTYYKAQNEAFMNGAWASGDYDTWLWDWLFSPSSEISTDIMYVLTTEAIGSWSDVYYSNMTYDNLYNASLQQIDPLERRLLTDQMQAMAYEDMGCQLVAYRKELYAVSNLGPDHWELASFGNWEEHYTLSPDQLYPWLYMQIEPADNHAPTITGFMDEYTTMTTTDTPMSGSAIDDHGVEYRWFFGDDNKTEWQSSPSVTHRYTHDGYYTAYLAVRELVGTDHFVTWRAAKVTVSDPSNPPPSDLSFAYEPTDPNTGDRVYFNGSATDAWAEPLTYSWNFGDGKGESGQNVTHQFTGGAGSYTVTMFVDDGHLGNVPRPVSFARVVPVTENSPPTIDVPDVTYVLKGVSNNITITSTDSDPRDMIRFTWDWGDGSALQVTSNKFASHTYNIYGLFTLMVHAADLTGLPGHNVSDQGLIKFLPVPETAPVITQFVKDAATVVTGLRVTFTGTATDMDSDLCAMRFDFGDGNETTLLQAAPNTSVSVSHTYTAGGPKTVYLYAFDGTLTTSSSMSFVVGTTFTLNLVTGWNLVSLPRVGSYNASTLGLNPGDTVSKWNSTTKSYKSYIVGVPANDFPIAPGTGFWINVPTGTRALTIYGYVPNTTQTINITVPPGGGWALIGFLGFKTRHASDIPGMWNGTGPITIVAKYNPPTKSYTSWLSVIPTVNNFLLLPGQAYWIFVGGSGKLTYDP